MIYLASKSPRRYDILKQIGLDFEFIQMDSFDENINKTKPSLFVQKLAKYKYNYVILSPTTNGYVCTFDTVVYFDGKILGKPKNKEQAMKMIISYKDKIQVVYTGFCISHIMNGKLKKQIVSYEKTKLFFADYSKEDVTSYVNTSNPLDKAGGYGIQDGGAVFIKRIDGCYFNVMGLPVYKFLNKLKELSFS